MRKEKINHPDHYNRGGRKECIVEMRELYGDEAVIHFCQLNVYKYKYRAGLKGKYYENMKKAAWYENYANKLIKEIKERGSSNVFDGGTYTKNKQRF